MAKQDGLIKLSGSIGKSEIVFVKAKQGHYVRAKAKQGIDTINEVLKKQRSRTVHVNALAKQLNDCIKYYANGFADKSNYISFLKLLRREPTDIRTLMLTEVRRFEVNSRYQFYPTVPDHQLTISAGKKKVRVTIEIKQHAQQSDNINSYQLELILMLWNSQDDGCRHTGARFPWIGVNMPLPISGHIDLERPLHTTDYVLMCRCIRATDNIDDGSFPNQGMSIVATGSFDAKGIQLLEAKEKEKKIAAIKESNTKNRTEVKGVWAKGTKEKRGKMG